MASKGSRRNSESNSRWLKKLVLTKYHKGHDIASTALDKLPGQFELYSRQQNPKDLNDGDLVLVPTASYTQDLIDCPYKKIVDSRVKEIDKLKLLRTVTECFGFYRNKILVPLLQVVAANTAQISQQSSPDSNHNFSRADFMRAAREDRMEENDYDALDDLRRRRNSSCHRNIVSQETVAELISQANSYTVFGVEVDGAPSYTDAVRRLAERLHRLHSEKFHPQEEFALTRFRNH